MIYLKEKLFIKKKLLLNSIEFNIWKYIYFFCGLAGAAATVLAGTAFGGAAFTGAAFTGATCAGLPVGPFLPLLCFLENFKFLKNFGSTFNEN